MGTMASHFFMLFMACCLHWMDDRAHQVVNTGPLTVARSCSFVRILSEFLANRYAGRVGSKPRTARETPPSRRRRARRRQRGNGEPGRQRTTGRGGDDPARGPAGTAPAGLRGDRASAPPAGRVLVGLIVPELDNPAFPRFAQAIESRLASKGLTTVLCTSTPAGMGENDYLDVLLDHEVVGIVIVSGAHADTTADHSRYLDLVARGVPTVLVNGSQPGLGPSTVTVDHADAARQAVAHLASLGHERIGLAVGPSRYLPTLDLMDGFREGLERGRAAGGRCPHQRDALQHRGWARGRAPPDRGRRHGHHGGQRPDGTRGAAGGPGGGPRRSRANCP
jgi:hypothetical protein